MTFVKRIERVALAVENLEQAREYFEKCFGANFLPIEFIEDMGIRYQPFEIGEGRMELLEATRDDSPVAKFLKARGGPGIHHITFEVDDLDRTIVYLKEKGVPITDGPTVTSSGSRFCFIDAPDKYEIELIERQKG